VSEQGLPVNYRVAVDAQFRRPSPEEIKQPDRPKLRDVLGPGLITGASDDDPSGIATYSQAGAQFGYSLGWTLLLTYPLMCAIQMISAQIGRVTGRGLAGNMRRHYPVPLLYVLVGLLIVANTINIGADLGAMAAALRLLVAGPTVLYVAAFAVVTVLLEVFMRYARYASVLRWLTLSLFAYVGTVFAVGVPWGTVARNLVLPHLEFSGSYLTVVVAVFGTTISPYLFFWQAGEEVEDEKENPAAEPLVKAPQQAPRELARIQIDTIVGMGFSNIIALFIMLTRLRRRSMRTASRIFKPRRKPRRLCARSPATLHSRSSPWASSALGCSPCRCSPGAPPTRSARLSNSGWGSLNVLVERRRSTA
jgi:Mn2+/Fe2+ NRAMP family transporter